MDDLVAFWQARLDEEHLAAYLFHRDAEWTAEMLATIWGRDPSDPIIRHAAFYDPARVLREVEAGRVILDAHQAAGFDRYGRVVVCCSTCVTGHEAYLDDDAPDPWPCRTARAAVSVWAGHPDYRDEWRP